MAVKETDLLTQEEEYVDLPFDELVASLNTPSKVASWMDKHREYDASKREGWTSDTTDRAYELALALYEKRGMICGNYAGFMVYCLRTHGYTTGGVTYLQKNGVVAHAGAYWLEGEKVKCFSLPKSSFNSIEEFKAFWIEEYDEFFGRKVHNLHNEYMEIISHEQLGSYRWRKLNKIIT
jgi:hypothetical protein